MKIILTSIMVSDQEKALDFYTGILGFEKKADIPMGEYRWLTVSSAESPEGIELVLEPMAFPPSHIFQKALYDAGIPATAFGVVNIEKEYERLISLGVVFKKPPAQMGPVKVAAFDDTCGNWIHIVQR